MKASKEYKPKQSRVISCNAQSFGNAKYEMIQRVSKSSWFGGDLFTVEHSDLNRGTSTTEVTRSYVNNFNYVPTCVLFDYAVSDVSTNDAVIAVTRNPNAYGVDNINPDNSYKSGRYWDAGHKLARQNGGYGHLNDWVFPQTPSINQGNSRLMNSQQNSFPLWRKHENQFYNLMSNHGAHGCWWLKLI